MINGTVIAFFEVTVVSFFILSNIINSLLFITRVQKKYNLFFQRTFIFFAKGYVNKKQNKVSDVFQL